ncbi:MAG: tandem-95 repeat protein, partial [Pirellulales bacterium]
YGTDSFTYQADDGTVRSSPGTVKLTVRAINDPPQANPDDKSTDEGKTLSFPAAELAANDTDPEGNPLTVTAVAATDDTHGTVKLVDSMVTYTPAAGFSGAASFAYTVSDSHGGLATGTVNVTVKAVNHPPVANPDGKSTDQGKALSFKASDLVANDVDPDGDPLTITAVAATDKTHGTVKLVQGTVTYTPAADFSGAASFAYTVSDSHGAVATGTVNVTVNPVAQIVPGTVKGLGTLDDGRREFDFSVQAKLKGQHGMAYSGELFFDDLRRGIGFQATSITLVKIDADGLRATITGTGKLNGVRGYTFTVQVEDRTASGKLDKFRIQIAGRRFKYDSLDYARHNGRIDPDGVIQIRRSPRRLPPTAIIRATDAAIESLPAMPSALWHRR